MKSEAVQSFLAWSTILASLHASLAPFSVLAPFLAPFFRYGCCAGNYGMAGYGFDPDFLFAWPNSRSGVMGGEQAAKTMAVVQAATAKRKGEIVPEDVLAQQSAMIQHVFDSQSESFVTSGRVLDHGIIDPRDTRKVLGFCLETVEEGRHRVLKSNSFGVARP